MSSTQEVSSGGVSSRRGERNRRSWLLQEETTLIEALKELIANGWKSDNGFRAGYLSRLEQALRREYPSTDIKAMPHINSKLSSWKKSYYSLNLILSRTGVGFNLRGNFMIDCEDDQWDQVLKADPSARLMRFKQWPHYDDWKELFGRDRATGAFAEDIQEACHEFQRNNHDATPDGGPADIEFTNESDFNNIAYEQVSQGSAAKKRKVNEDLKEMCELLADMNRSTNDRLQYLGNRIGYEFDMGQARQETFDQLGEITGLSLENRFIVCELVAFKAERLDIWRGMKQEARAQYVDHLLRTNVA